MADSPLSGCRVIDASTLFAGPMAAMVLGDFGAEVIKVEHPSRPDPSRTHGPSRYGEGLGWKTLGRNKRTITLDLSKVEGQDIFVRLAATADVVIENFRPGTLERWNLDYERLAAANAGLILARVTGFGQFGPAARKPGFGTLAEAMSGFAAATGERDGPPMLPPFGLADGIASLATTTAITSALLARHTTGKGQVVDVAIIEPILSMLGPQITAYDQLGLITERSGNRSTNNAPRNLYLSADDRWLAVSTSSQNIARRVIGLVGRADLTEEDWFQSASGRVAHGDELDQAVARWIADRTAAEVMAEFERVEAAIAPVYDASDLANDDQLEALGTIITIEDDDLGPIQMQNVLFRLSDTPGRVRFPGRSHGADTNAVLQQLGLTVDELDALRHRKVI